MFQILFYFPRIFLSSKVPLLRQIYGRFRPCYFVSLCILQHEILKKTHDKVFNSPPSKTLSKLTKPIFLPITFNNPLKVLFSNKKNTITTQTRPAQIG